MTKWRSLLLLLFTRPVVSNSLWPHGLQPTRPPCSSPSPKVCPNSCPLHQRCHPSISFSDTLFSFCPQSFPASGTFTINWLFASGDQNTRASVSALVLPMRIQRWFPLRLTGLISSLFKGLSRVFSSTAVRRHQFFGALPSYGPALTNLCDHWEDHSPAYMDFCQQSDVSAFPHTV